MATTNNSNSSHVTPPPALTPAVAAKSGALTTVYFRQSADGVNFTVTPVYLHPTDAAHAISRSPGEYALTSNGFAAWPGGLNNSAQSPGGRGRLQGSVTIAD